MPRSKQVVGCLRPCLLVFCMLLVGSGLRAEDREQWQQPDRVMADLHLRPGMRVADVGCGTGYFTFRLARAVGPKGKVFALDVSSDAFVSASRRLRSPSRPERSDAPGSLTTAGDGPHRRPSSRG